MSHHIDVEDGDEPPPPRLNSGSDVEEEWEEETAWHKVGAFVRKFSRKLSVGRQAPEGCGDSDSGVSENSITSTTYVLHGILVRKWSLVI